MFDKVSHIIMLFLFAEASGVTVFLVQLCG